MMQHLLLSVIGEAAESGISRVILVLAPGTVEYLYVPVKEVLDLSIVPSIELHYVEQARPEGLGDALLQAEDFVGDETFAVLLPDDVILNRIGQTSYPRELCRMIDGFRSLGEGHIVVVTSVSKSKMDQCGVAKLSANRGDSGLIQVARLVEKPDLEDPAYRSSRTYGIVGRYILGPEIFSQLRQVKQMGHRPVQLTDALEQLRQGGSKVYAMKLEATRQDVGEVLGQASKIMESSSRLAAGSTSR
jgi:UTP--glucose-1-phosphate uridylyltransferase